jgi:hypothetical protein
VWGSPYFFHSAFVIGRSDISTRLQQLFSNVVKKQLFTRPEYLSQLADSTIMMSLCEFVERAIRERIGVDGVAYSPALLYAWAACVVDTAHTVRSRAIKAVRTIALADGVGAVCAACIEQLGAALLDGTLIGHVRQQYTNIAVAGDVDSANASGEIEQLALGQLGKRSHDALLTLCTMANGQVDDSDKDALVAAALHVVCAPCVGAYSALVSFDNLKLKYVAVAYNDDTMYSVLQRLYRPARGVAATNLNADESSVCIDFLLQFAIKPTQRARLVNVVRDQLNNVVTDDNRVTVRCVETAGAHTHCRYSVGSKHASHTCAIL